MPTIGDIASLPRYVANVKEYGAVGDGTTDDTAAFTAAAAANKFVLVPYSASGYNVASSVVNNGSTFVFMGGYPYVQLVGSATVHQLNGVGFNVGQITAEQLRLILSPNTLTGTNEGDKRGLFIQQYEPDTTSTDYGDGPFYFNQILTTWTGERTGTGIDGSSTSALVRGLHVSLAVGGEDYQLQSAAAIGAGLNHTTNDTATGDKIGIGGGLYTNAASPGKVYGSSFAVTVDEDGDTPQAIGTEVDIFVNTGATVPVALGFNAWSGGTEQASDVYAAYAVSRSGASSAVPWKTGFLLYEVNGKQPIATTGSLFRSTGNVTLTNIFSFANVTTTGYIFDFPTFKVDGGGLVTLSQGIKFPASQVASSDANTLDDYEEGSWTPGLTFETAGDLSVAYSIQTGRYTKIGNVVHIRASILTSTFTHTTASGALRVTGLPFAASSALTNGLSAGFSGWTSAGYTQTQLAIQSGQTYATITTSGSGMAAGVLTKDEVTSGTTKTLFLSGSYEV